MKALGVPPGGDDEESVAADPRSMWKFAGVLALVFVCGCHRSQATIDRENDAAAHVAAAMANYESDKADAQAAVPSAAPAGPDPKLTKKRGEDLMVTFVGAHVLPKDRAILAFVLDNVGDQEQPVTPNSVQATTVAGLACVIEHERAQLCLGQVPPHGRLACQVLCTLQGGAARRLRVRVDGAWFLVDLEEPTEAGTAR